MGHIWVNPWPKIWFLVWRLPFLCGANLCLALLLVYVEEIIITLFIWEKIFLGVNKIIFFGCVPTMFSICSQVHYPISQCAQYMFPIVPHFSNGLPPIKFPPSPREGTTSSHRNFYFGELSNFIIIFLIFRDWPIRIANCCWDGGGIIGMCECGGRAPNYVNN